MRGDGVCGGVGGWRGGCRSFGGGTRGRRIRCKTSESADVGRGFEYKHILWLDVAVRDPLRVEVTEGENELTKDAACRCLIHSSKVADERKQITFIGNVMKQECVLLGDERAKEPYDVWTLYA